MITIEDIAVELGRTTPEAESIEAKQWESWIKRAMAAIEARATSLGVPLGSIDPDALDEVVIYAVVRRISRPPDAAVQVSESVGVDDASWRTDRRYSTGVGDVWISDDWWSRLGLSGGDPGWSGSIGYGGGL
ncbi:MULTISPECIES: hypothetical protein [unclassified Luteococcus]|uniref:hypothetical protein n=1 Tax=unclassified Luteococcus TaxID=2639923 RepID=UPI00313DA7A9